MSIVKVHKKSGIYAYESIPRWVPELHQSRPIKKYLGKVDPDTGEIIPSSGRKGRKKKEYVLVEEQEIYKDLYISAKEEIEQLKLENNDLRGKLEEAQEKYLVVIQKCKIAAGEFEQEINSILE